MKKLLLLAVLSGWTLIPAALAEDAPEHTPLGIRQEGVAGEMAMLEQKIVKLIQELRASEPEQAARLQKALNYAKEKQVSPDMQRVAELLNRKEFNPAIKDEAQLTAALEKLIRILVEDEDEFEKTRKEIERLEKWKGTLRQLVREEWQEKRDSEKTSAREEESKRLEGAIGKLEELKKKQQDLRAATESAMQNPAADLGEMERKQAELKEKTGELAKELGKPAAEEKRDDLKEPGQEALEQAAGHQESSRANLAGKKAKSSSGDQQKALEKMDQALSELKREKERMDHPQSDDNSKMKEKQDATGDKTDKLAEEMKKAAEDAKKEQEQNGSDSQNEQQQQNSQQSPGQQSVESAQRQMGQASKQLGQNSPQQASPQQKQAVENLKKAEQEVDKKLDELKKQQQQELLEKLKAIYEQMLVRQMAVSKSTAELEARKEKWTRVDELECGKGAAEETALRETAEKTLAMMDEDGTATVFPPAVEGLRDDLEKSAGLMGEKNTGALAQHLQKQIEETLKDLIAALEEAQKNPQQPQQSQSGSGSGQQQKQPLVSDLAEMKLLLSMQQRTNRRTKDLDALLQKTGKDAGVGAESLNLSGKQEEIERLTRKMLKKLSRQQDAPNLPGTAPAENQTY